DVVMAPEQAIELRALARLARVERAVRRRIEAVGARAALIAGVVDVDRVAPEGTGGERAAVESSARIRFAACAAAAPPGARALLDEVGRGELLARAAGGAVEGRLERKAAGRKPGQHPVAAERVAVARELAAGLRRDAGDAQSELSEPGLVDVARRLEDGA